MLAEVSDFNPNVFFECGFALGLGRRVVFLCDDKSEDIKAKLGEQLYKSYQTVDEIPDKLGWKTEKFNNNKINDLYQVPRVFKHINNFNSPNDRDKSNEVYVVSFNHETELVRKLTERYSYTKVAINILDQCFIPEGLAESLINARAVLVNLAGVQRGSNDNKMHDAQLMFLAGICVSQGVPVKIFQSHKNFYRDVWNISIMDNSGEDIVKFADACPYKNTE
jgi:nucleoside 2-deoxyribosyltransferase